MILVIEVFKTITSANIPCTGFILKMKNFIQHHSQSELTLGNVMDMPRVYVPIAHEDCIRKIMELLVSSKVEYGVVFDGNTTLKELNAL